MSESTPETRRETIQRDLRHIALEMRRENIPYQEAANMISGTMLAMALSECHGNQCAAARLLGLHRNSMRTELVKHKVKIGAWREPVPAKKPANPVSIPQAAKAKAGRVTAAVRADWKYQRLLEDLYATEMELG